MAERTSDQTRTLQEDEIYNSRLILTDISSTGQQYLRVTILTKLGENLKIPAG